MGDTEPGGVTGRRQDLRERASGLKWLRKRSVAKRYDCTERTVDRMRDSGRIRAPHYPFGNEVPAWLEHELDEDDLAAVAREEQPTEGVERQRRGWRGRPRRDRAASAA
jgi:hypothetical protein